MSDRDKLLSILLYKFTQVKISIYVSVLFFFFFTSCKTEVTQLNKEELKAKWTIVEAKRNGKLTSTLDEAFFIISDSTIFHNLNGESLTSSYSLNKNVISMNDELIHSMDIIKLLNDTLITKTKISDFRFDFTMIKNEDI